jgi:hypothetical protein
MIVQMDSSFEVAALPGKSALAGQDRGINRWMRARQGNQARSLASAPAV